jgi:hypothetical protein
MLLQALKQHETHLNDCIALIFKDLSPNQIIDGMKNQLDAYWWGKWLFDQEIENSDPLVWWQAHKDHPHFHVLAVSSSLPMQK